MAQVKPVQLVRLNCNDNNNNNKSLATLARLPLNANIKFTIHPFSSARPLV